MLGIVIVGVILGCLIAAGIWRLKRSEPLKPVSDIMRAEDLDERYNPLEAGDDFCVPDRCGSPQCECAPALDNDPQEIRTQAQAEIDAVLNPAPKKTRKARKVRKTRAKSKRRSNRRSKK